MGNHGINNHRIPENGKGVDTMKTKAIRWLWGVVVLWDVAAHAVWAVTPTPEELAQTRRWAAAKFEGVAETGLPTAGRPGDGVDPFLSFTYGGKPSSERLKTWEINRSTRALDAQRTEHTLTYTDPQTGCGPCVGIEYRDFPAVEWVVHLQNTGTADTPILEAIQADRRRAAAPQGRASRCCTGPRAGWRRSTISRRRRPC